MRIVLKYEIEPLLSITIESYGEAQIVSCCIVGLDTEVRRRLRGRGARREYNLLGQSSLKAIFCDQPFNRHEIEVSGLTIERDLAVALLEALRWKRENPMSVYGLDAMPEFEGLMRTAEVMELERHYGLP